MLDTQARIEAVLAGGDVLAERNRQMAEMVEPLFQYRPLRENPLLAKIAPWMADALAREDPDDPYFRELDHRAHYRTLDLPALHIGGWYDINVNGTIANFVGMSAHAATDVARRAQRLVVGPWPHWTPQISVVGDVDFGPNAVLDLEPLRREWFGHWLQDQPAPMLDRAPIRIFVMGENVWRDEWEWPLARTEWTSWYLHSGGHANTSDGDGVLGLDAPAQVTPADTFVYDPRDPVPTQGGRLLGVGGVLAGAFDQRDVETRPDVLVYTTPPLEQAVEITGPVRVELWASTSAPDTDFTAKLVEVHADGRAINLCDGIVRADVRADAADRRRGVSLHHRAVGDQCARRRGQPDPARDLVEQLPALRAQLQLREAGRHRYRRRHPDCPPDRLPRPSAPEPADPPGNSPLIVCA